MRRAARTDANHADTVRYLRQCGMSVQDLSRVGKGCPDLLVGWRGMCWTVEVKNPNVNLSHQKLTPDEVKWRAKWAGPYILATSGEDAERQITAAYRVLMKGGMPTMGR